MKWIPWFGWLVETNVCNFETWYGKKHQWIGLYVFWPTGRKQMLETSKLGKEKITSGHYLKQKETTNRRVSVPYFVLTSGTNTGCITAHNITQQQSTKHNKNNIIQPKLTLCNKNSMFTTF